MVRWADWRENFWRFWVINNKKALDGELFSNEELLKEANQELTLARNMFSRVEDPEMVDSAIFTLKAAEKRYDYLLKEIKNKY